MSVPVAARRASDGMANASPRKSRAKAPATRAAIRSARRLKIMMNAELKAMRGSEGVCDFFAFSVSFMLLKRVPRIDGGLGKANQNSRHFILIGTRSTHG